MAFFTDAADFSSYPVIGAIVNPGNKEILLDLVNGYRLPKDRDTVE